MKKFRISQLPIIVQVFLAMFLGMSQGWFMPAWFIRIFVTFNDFFGQFIGFLVPLIILALVTASIANSQHGAGRMLRVTMAVVLLSTFLAGVASMGVSEWIIPMFVTTGEEVVLAPRGGEELAPFFTLQLPPALDVMSALMMALMLGLGMRAVQADSLRKGISELQKLVMLSIEKAIIPLLPVYIFGVFLKMSASGGIIELARDFLWVILLVIAMLVVWTLFLYSIAGLLAHRNPFKLLWAMMPAGMVAFATCSSAATIPVSLERAKHLTRDENTASFVIPLCANLHIPSVSIHFVICAIAVMMMVGQPVELGSFIPYMIMLTMTCVAVPGVPGGVVAVLPVMASMLGFTPEMQALCLSLGVLLDAPLTAMNVLCDGAVCTIVDNRVICTNN